MTSEQLNVLRFGERKRITDKAAISYPVELHPMKFAEESIESSVNGDRGLGVVRADTNRLICHAGSDYQLVLHEDVLRLVEATFTANSMNFELYDLHQGGVRQNRMFANYIMPEHKFDIEGDEYKPFVQVCNSYDKTLLFRSLTGLYRVKCSNGNLLGMKDTQLISAKHVGKNIDLGDIAFDMNNWLETLEITKTKLKKLLHTPLPETPIKEIAASIFKAKRDSEMFVQSQLVADAVKEFGDNSYALFNAFTNYATHKLPNFTTSSDWVLLAQKKITNVFFEMVEN